MMRLRGWCVQIEHALTLEAIYSAAATVGTSARMVVLLLLLL